MSIFNQTLVIIEAKFIDLKVVIVKMRLLDYYFGIINFPLVVHSII